MSISEKTKKKSIFDKEYGIRFVLICVIGISIIMLSWTYKFKTNTVIELDEQNSKIFDDKFNSLAGVSQHGEYRELNISMMGQKMINYTNINRLDYDMDLGVFSNLPFIPNDWSNVKYAYDNGRYYILRDISEEYYKQPEFYGDWSDLGMSYHENNGPGCKTGMFVTPSVQKIYTNAGATIQTYVIARSSFCNSIVQSLKFKPMYPLNGTMDDGTEFVQNPLIVERNINLEFEPNGFILGKSYPRFDPDWAKKVAIKISVSDSAPDGIYVVSLGLDEFKSPMIQRSDVSYDSYKSAAGSAVVNFVIAVG